MKKDFVLETVEQLTTKHDVSLNAKVLFHLDRGSHYTAHSLIELLKDKNLRRSMSRKGNCWDNAPQESFYGHMKDHIRVKLTEVHEFVELTVQILLLKYRTFPVSSSKRIKSSYCCVQSFRGTSE